MSTRTRHTEATRKVIVDAAVDLFVARNGDDFSVQEVADSAGLTHRTVYRYFPTRMHLVDAAAKQLAPTLTEDLFVGVSSVEEWIEAMEPNFARIEANFEVMRKVVAAALTASPDEYAPNEHVSERDAHRWEMFRGQFPNLSDDDARKTFATLRHLMSTTSYVMHRLRSGLSPTEVTEAIQSAALQIAEQAARRDRAARRRSS